MNTTGVFIFNDIKPDEPIGEATNAGVLFTYVARVQVGITI